MADGTPIEWADATVNAVNGCSLASPGCTNCYAMSAGGRNLPHHPSTGLTRPTKAGHVWTGEVRLNERALMTPLRWKAPRRIFWNAHGDLFHPNVPDEWIDRCFAVMALAPQHTHMVLTKRAERMRAYVTSRVALQGNIGGSAVGLALEHGKQVFRGITTTYPAKSAEAREMVIDRVANILPNVWLGVSVEDQVRADERVPELLAMPAAVRFLSCEPLLGPVDLTRISLGNDVFVDATTGVRYDELGARAEGEALDWVIGGGESGPRARPMHPNWARDLRDQCASARVPVPFLFKQWGEWAPSGPGMEPVPHDRQGWVHVESGRCIRDPSEDDFDGIEADEHAAGRSLYKLMLRVGKKAAGRLLDGVEYNGFPPSRRQVPLGDDALEARSC